jgi:benzylsuccinate CoA-transferase BbsE subunit
MVENNEKILQEIRILDLADEKASFCSKILADMGASVIKIERPGGDRSRSIGPFWKNSSHPERSLFFWYHNMNKKGITLNLEHRRGKEIFLRLIERTDVVIETFAPGYLSDTGLGFEALIERNPKLILVSVTGFGQTGPRKGYKSCNLVASAFGGQMYVSGSPSTAPLKPFGEQCYYTASLFAAIGILLALRKRTHTGKGEHIDISLQEAVASTLEHVMIRYFNEHITRRRQGSLYWNNSFCILPCINGHILLTPTQEWETLVEWLDSEGMAEDLTDEKWKSENYRIEHLNHILGVLKRWTQTHSVEELFEMGQLMRFPWAPVASPKDVVKNPQLKARGFVEEASCCADADPKFSFRSPLRFSSESLSRGKQAPTVGEDNFRIYHGELGIPIHELERLSAMSVI